ncbi:MAG: invasion associated locus B family protein [Pseudomonadota bacterium]
MRSRLVSSSILFIATSLLVWFSGPPALAQAVFQRELPKIDWSLPESPWKLSCPRVNEQTGTPICVLSQTLKVAKSGQHLLTALVRVPPEKDGKKQPAIMLFTLPHGLFFRAGVKLQIDSSKPFAIPYQSSDVRGAYAGLHLTNTILNALKMGSIMKVTVEASSRKPLTMNVSLKGFTAHFAKLVE